MNSATAVRIRIRNGTNRCGGIFYMSNRSLAEKSNKTHFNIACKTQNKFEV